MSLPKNKWTTKNLRLTCFRPFFWKKLKTPKTHFKINAGITGIRKIAKKISFWYKSQINPTAINTYRRDVLSLADRDRKATCKIKKEAIAYTRVHTTTASLWVMGGISGYISSDCYSGLLELETLGILFHSVLLHSTTYKQGVVQQCVRWRRQTRRSNEAVTVAKGQ